MADILEETKLRTLGYYRTLANLLLVLLQKDCQLDLGDRNNCPVVDPLDD